MALSVSNLDRKFRRLGGEKGKREGGGACARKRIAKEKDTTKRGEGMRNEAARDYPLDRSNRILRREYELVSPLWNFRLEILSGFLPTL